MSSSTRTKKLSQVRVLGPWMKTEHHLQFPESVKLRYFFGLPELTRIESVKIGHLAYAETGAIGKVVLPNQPVVVTIENQSPKPVSLENALVEFEDLGAPNILPEAAPTRKTPPCPKAGLWLVEYNLLFGAGSAHVKLQAKETCLFEDVWVEGASLSNVSILGTRYEGRALYEWRGVAMPEGTDIELAFTPLESASTPRAIVCLQKLSFPNANVSKEKFR